ncbi:MAG: aminodeoxychorismate lyase [Thiotrichales bacterium]|nr:aminodeoxychorismate lyase [Thiotrichales bacterium]
MTIWHKGAPLQGNQLCFEAEMLDRGLQYGDGFFTTLLLQQGKVVNWPAHLQRIKHSAERLKFCNFGLETLVEDFSHFVQSLEGQSAESIAVKILVTRGFGGKGYQPLPDEEQQANWVFQSMPFPQAGGVALSNFEKEAVPPTWQIFPQRVTTSDVRCAQQPLLAGLKHLNRLENVLARQALIGTPFDEAIMCDTTGNCVSGTQSNLLWLKDDTVFTPDLSQSGVSGTTLPVILKLAERLGYKVEVGSFALAEVAKADEVFFCNALRGVMPATEWQNDGEILQFSTEKTAKLAYHWLSWASDNQTDYLDLANEL